jgi:hypothetical protein
MSDTATGATPGTDPRTDTPTEVDTTNIPETVANDEARAAAVRGVNPSTGSAAYLVERAGEDKDWAAVTLALRQAPVGAFHSLAADLRSVEASVTAAQELMAAFDAAGITISVKKPEPQAKESSPATSSSRKG